MSESTAREAPVALWPLPDVEADDGVRDYLAIHRVEPRPNVGLRYGLVTGDVVAVVLSWALALVITGGFAAVGSVADVAVGLGVVALSLGVVAQHRLYQARVCAVRAVEVQRLGRAMLVAGVIALAVVALTALDMSAATIVVGQALAFVSLTLGRGAYRAWLGSQRRSGRYDRPVLLVGANEDACDLLQLTREHPELGLRIIGVVAPRAEAHVVDALWLGEIDNVEHIASRAGVTGVLVASGVLPPVQLAGTVSGLVGAGQHVHLSTGLRGIAANRLRTMPLAHEPLFYLEQATLSPWQTRVKRVLDFAFASVLLLAALPVLAIAALAIKLDDGGKVLFRQERVGRGGQRFTLNKLRTMVPDAEALRGDLTGENQRAGGPLFKLASDPRVTRVGRFLRSSSIDEIPQLWNVLNGTMSLVGPRPALPEEVEQFDDRLQTRHQVLPGITGLWQVQARDNPNFGPYSRLDLYYVENWSVGLDLSILFSTVGVVLGRTGRAVGQPFRRSPSETAQPVAVLD